MQNDCGYVERSQCDDPLRPHPGAGACDYPERCAYLREHRECPFYTFVGLKRDIIALKTVGRRPTDEELLREIERRRAVVTAPRTSAVAAAFARVTAIVNGVCVVQAADAPCIVIPEWATFCHRVRELEVITDAKRVRIPAAKVQLVHTAGVLHLGGGVS